MSLPTAFSSPALYFAQALAFLKDYSWIYKHANTCFLKNEVLDEMPLEFQDYFLHITTDDLNKFPLLLIPLEVDSKYEKVAQFRENLKRLIPEESFQESSCKEIPIPFHLKAFQKMNPKKRHEIARLSYLITNLVERNEVLIDFGSGLGYLSELLHHDHERRQGSTSESFESGKKMIILGLEADEYRVEAARKRQMEYMPETSNQIEYKKEFISLSSKELIEESFEELATRNGILNPKMCLVGLHSCADLTITSMKLFLTMRKVSKLIIMPCCYHKMGTLKSKEFAHGEERLEDHFEEPAPIEGTVFENFPLSETMKATISEASKDNEYTKLLNTPFLRLASQQTTARWLQNTEAEHLSHGKEMFWRALAECLLQPDELVTKQTKRLNLSSLEISSFEDFKQIYRLKSRKDHMDSNWSGEHEEKFLPLFTKYASKGPSLAEGLTCLQTAMQKLCENIVLYDRLCYMREYASKEDLNLEVRYQKILNEQLSPRCYVLIAKKL